MRNVTLTCPNCTVPSRAVGDPNEDDNGWSGDWYCFNCKSAGKYKIEFVLEVGASPVVGDVSTPGSDVTNEVSVDADSGNEGEAVNPASVD